MNEFAHGSLGRADISTITTLDAIFEDISNVEFRRIDPSVVLSLSYSDQDPAEESEGRHQRALFLALADGLNQP